MDSRLFSPPWHNEKTVRIFKLHGSLNWRLWNNGNLERVPTEEPTRNSYYKGNVFIYPTEYCNESIEPYQTLYGNFKQLKQKFDVTIVIGYSFRDEPINNVLIEFLQQDTNKKIIVLSPTANDDCALIKKTNPKGELVLINEMFPDSAALSDLSNQF